MGNVEALSLILCYFHASVTLRAQSLGQGFTEAWLPCPHNQASLEETGSLGVAVEGLLPPSGRLGVSWSAAPDVPLRLPGGGHRNRRQAQRVALLSTRKLSCVSANLIKPEPPPASPAGHYPCLLFPESSLTIS